MNSRQSFNWPVSRIEFRGCCRCWEEHLETRPVTECTMWTAAWSWSGSGQVECSWFESGRFVDGFSWILPVFGGEWTARGSQGHREVSVLWKALLLPLAFLLLRSREFFDFRGQIVTGSTCLAPVSISSDRWTLHTHLSALSQAPLALTGRRNERESSVPATSNGHVYGGQTSTTLAIAMYLPFPCQISL